jgi:hypothetical protein
MKKMTKSIYFLAKGRRASAVEAQKLWPMPKKGPRQQSDQTKIDLSSARNIDGGYHL